MIIRDFDIVCITCFETKTDTPLHVDTDAPLPISLSFEDFEMVGRRHPKIILFDRLTDDSQFVEGSLVDVMGYSFGPFEFS